MAYEEPIKTSDFRYIPMRNREKIEEITRRIEDMARGWESKSVEEQMASVQQAVPIAPANGFNEEARRAAEQERVRRARQVQALNLQKENILSQRTSNPARRQALEAALAQIEAEIAKLH
jgi:hypothetical protein